MSYSRCQHVTGSEKIGQLSSESILRVAIGDREPNLDYS